MQNEFYSGNSYLSFDQLESYCRQLAAEYPQWVAWKEVGRSRENRPIFCLVVGAQDSNVEKRPTVWLDGGTHATEWVGVMSAVYSMSRWVADLASGEETLANWFCENTVVVLPCISPDGYHASSQGTAYIRSTLRPPKDGTTRIGLDPSDINSDGHVLYMRWKHPAGNMVEDTHCPMLMRRRTLDDPAENAFFLTWEGHFINWDGTRWTNAESLHALDLNRNFPARWTPFSMFGMDSGDYALSEPESRATVEAFSSFPYICAAVTNHSYSGCLLTQPYSPQTPLGEPDIRLLDTLAKQLVAGTGYKTFKVLTEFAYDAKKDIVGVWADTMSTVFGVPAYTLEIWDPYSYAGINVKQPAMQLIDPDPELLRSLLQHMEQHHPELCHAWTPYQHPQLGSVEIGGIDYIRAIHNPPPALLLEECKKSHRIIDRLRLAVPQIESQVTTRSLDGNCYEVLFSLENTGFLASSGLSYGKTLRPTPGTSAVITCSEGLELLSPSAEIKLEHLEGWGSVSTGLAGHPLFPELPPNGRLGVRWLVKGKGKIDIAWRLGRAGVGSASLVISNEA